MAFDYSLDDWDGLRYHMRNVPWEEIFKLVASAAAMEFRGSVQVGIDVYIPHCKYHLKPHSSSWFSADSAAELTYGWKSLFRLHQQNKFSEAKVKLGQAGNRSKKVLEAAKLVYADKTNKIQHLPEASLSGHMTTC